MKRLLFIFFVSLSHGLHVSAQTKAVLQAANGGVTPTEVSYLDNVTSAIQTQLDAKLSAASAATTYQPLATLLTSFSGLSNAAGVLTNNGSGTLSYKATSSGGNGPSDDQKLVTFDTNGGVTVSSALSVAKRGVAAAGGVYLQALDGVYVFLTPSEGMGTAKTLTFPSATGTLIGTGDTGTVSNTMLAGSIAISKLSITGTPDGSKFLRDDGTWQAAGGALTIGGTITGGTSGRLLTSGATLGELTLGTGVSTWLGAPTIANLNTAVSDADLAVIAGNAFTGANTVTLTSLSTTPTAAFSLINSTSSAAGSQQVSPSLVWTGQGWKTTATAASQQVDFRAYVLPVQGAANPTAQWVLQSQVNGGGFATAMIVDSANGIYLGANSLARIWNNGNRVAFSSSNGSTVQIEGTAAIWCRDDTAELIISSSADLRLGRDGPATWQSGVDAATATTQSFKAHDGSGTDKDGAIFQTAGGQSTGTGRGGATSRRTSLSAASTGSSLNSYSTRDYHSAKPVSLTESTATTFTNISIASGGQAGARLICTVEASDGTDHQSLTSEVTVDGINKAGTLTATLTQGDNTTAASAGTLTATYTVTAGTNSIDIKCNAVSSLTQTTLRCKWSIVSLNSNGVATVTPQ